MASVYSALALGILGPLCAGAAWIFYRRHGQPRGRRTIDKKTQQALRRYVLLESTHGKPHSVLKTFREYTKQNHLVREMMFSPEQDIYLEEAVRECSPTMALVLGTQCGYSAIRLLSLLPPGGRVYAVEEDDTILESAEEMILVSGYKNHQFSLLCKDPVDAILALHHQFGQKKVDLVIIDCDKYIPSFKALTEAGLLYPGTLILLHNINHSTAKEFVDHLENAEHYRVVDGCLGLIKVQHVGPS
ncbi:transmembrane O-methyltransferase homolog [Hyperolius riggenbachi]|uniref:transmembrane O-methyltransferase homolog n=1 Tax=Hyperolius riggenbachi TaxID=752182 RepID=UPI0035A2AC2E